MIRELRSSDEPLVDEALVEAVTEPETQLTIVPSIDIGLAPAATSTEYRR